MITGLTDRSELPMVQLVLFGTLTYFIPTLIAFVRGHSNKVGIMALNLLLGWTILGWIGAFVWSLLRSRSVVVIPGQNDPSKYEQLEQLERLYKGGSISEEEYRNERNALLKQ